MKCAQFILESLVDDHLFHCYYLITLEVLCPIDSPISSCKVQQVKPEMWMIMIIIIIMLVLMMMTSTGWGYGLVTRLSIVSSNRNTEVTMIEGNQVRNIVSFISCSIIFCQGCRMLLFIILVMIYHYDYGVTDQFQQH